MDIGGFREASSIIHINEGIWNDSLNILMKKGGGINLCIIIGRKEAVTYIL
jgi:hypothetical protein